MPQIKWDLIDEFGLLNIEFSGIESASLCFDADRKNLESVRGIKYSSQVDVNKITSGYEEKIHAVIDSYDAKIKELEEELKEFRLKEIISETKKEEIKPEVSIDYKKVEPRHS